MNPTHLDKISENIFHLVTEYFELFPNDTSDFRKPHLRESVRYVYPLFIFLYSLIFVLGTASNVAVLVTIVRRRLHHDPTYYFVGNLAVSDIVKCLAVLPVTLANLLVKNWIFGSFLCYFIPMAQYIPIYATTLTFLLIAVDRYRLILHPLTARVPRFICVLGLWVLAFCVVLPFCIYITYVDFEALFHDVQFRGTGLCVVNANDNIEEYMRGLFIALYVLPLAIVTFLYVRVSGEIQCRENPSSLMLAPTSSGSGPTGILSFEMSSTDERCSGGTRRTSADGTPCPTRSSWVGGDGPSTGSAGGDFSTGRLVKGDGENGGGNGLNQHNSVVLMDPWPASAVRASYYYDDDDFDPRREKRTQKYLITMVTLFAACICPLEILRLVKHAVIETYSNTGHFDMAYIIFVWIGFLPTCTTPILFASWVMTRPAKDRLKGYFRFSNHQRRRHRSASNASNATATVVASNIAVQPPPPQQPFNNHSLQQHNPPPQQSNPLYGGHSNEGYTPSSSSTSAHPSALYAQQSAPHELHGRAENRK